MLSIELTDAQREALRASRKEPIDVVDPSTHEHYVLLTHARYDQVRLLLAQLPDLTVEAESKTPPGVFRSMHAYWRALPELVKLKPPKKRWVAYHGEERIGWGRTQAELYQECFRRGLRADDIYVGPLEIDPEGIPPWATVDGEQSLYEFDDNVGAKLARNEE